MDSVIIISSMLLDSEWLEENVLSLQDSKYSFDNDRDTYTVSLEGFVGYIHVHSDELSAELSQEYDIEELNKIAYKKCYFTLIDYHHGSDFLEVILHKFNNVSEVYIDDDCGYIGKLDMYLMSKVFTNRYTLELQGLSWFNKDEQVKEATNILVSINKNYLGLLIMPINKNRWDNAAKVIEEIGYPRIEAVIFGLIRWLKDMNWPGAMRIFKLLLELDDELLSMNIKKALAVARMDEDDEWIDNTYALARKKQLNVD